MKKILSVILCGIFVVGFVANAAFGQSTRRASGHSRRVTTVTSEQSGAASQESEVAPAAPSRSTEEQRCSVERNAKNHASSEYRDLRFTSHYSEYGCTDITAVFAQNHTDAAESIRRCRELQTAYSQAEDAYNRCAGYPVVVGHAVRGERSGVRHVTDPSHEQPRAAENAVTKGREPFDSGVGAGATE